MILARVLYERAMRSKTDVLRSYGANIAWIMGRNLVWKRAFLYQEPATLQHIRQIYFALDREYRQLEADAALDDAQNAGALSFYEETLLRDLRRFRYILLSGRLAVNVLQSLKEAEQYFQGENNRGLPMSLLDILKAYHMRFETAPDRQKEIRRIWSAFNESPPSESDRETHDDEASKAAAARLAQRKYAVEAHVIPALLMRCDIDPWPESANSPQNADLLKGIIGTHRRDRIVDGKLSASSNQHLFDLLEPVQTGIGFFRMLDQYRRIDEALDELEQTAFNPASGLKLNNDQRLILRLALIAWTDRFAPRTAFMSSASSHALAAALAADAEFRAFARHFARFLNRLRNADKQIPGAFNRLDKAALLRCLRYWNARTNLIFLPHRSATPAACKRSLLQATTPEAMAPYIKNTTWIQRYRLAYDMEAALEASAADTEQNTTDEASDHE